MGRRGKTTVRCKIIINGKQKTFNNRAEEGNIVRGMRLQASRWIDSLATEDRINGYIAVNYGLSWDDNEARFETFEEGKEWVRESLDQELVDYIKN